MRHLLFQNLKNMKDCHDQIIYAFAPSSWIRQSVLKKLRSPGGTYRDAIVPNSEPEVSVIICIVLTVRTRRHTQEKQIGHRDARVVIDTTL